MNPEWPLILFTFFLCLSGGILGAQGLLTVLGKGKKMQNVALIAALATLVIGGICVFMHLQHWERIFNGFGHITSGITQELIAIVAFVAVAVAYFAMARKSDDGGTLPKWMAWAAIAVSVVLAAVCAHSYMMPEVMWPKPLKMRSQCCRWKNTAMPPAARSTQDRIASSCWDFLPAPLSASTPAPPNTPQPQAVRVVNKIRGHCSSMIYSSPCQSRSRRMYTKLGSLPTSGRW